MFFSLLSKLVTDRWACSETSLESRLKNTAKTVHPKTSELLTTSPTYMIHFDPSNLTYLGKDPVPHHNQKATLNLLIVEVF